MNSGVAAAVAGWLGDAIAWSGATRARAGRHSSGRGGVHVRVGGCGAIRQGGCVGGELATREGGADRQIAPPVPG